MTILAPPDASTSANDHRSADATMAEEDPLRRKRRALQDQQAQLDEIRQTIEQLRYLDGDAVHTSDRGRSTAWKLIRSGSDGAKAGDVVASQLTNGQILVPMNGVAFVKGDVIGDAPPSKRRGTVWVESEAKISERIDKSNALNGKVEVPIAALRSELQRQQQELERMVAAQREDVMKMASEYFSKHVGESLGVENVELDEQGQAVNEEGLPFIDLTEPVPLEEHEYGRGVVLPFEPAKKNKEERRTFIDSILDNLEDEERLEGGGSDREEVAMTEGDKEAFLDVQRSARPTSQSSMHKRVASADRPAPVKSVLKHTSHSSSGASTPQRFGASGFRKGFLNMNPSSPGAEHSSDPIEKILWKSDDPMSASTSSFGSMADHVRSADGGGNNSSGGEDRMSRSTELQPAKKKKTVRIQSPAAQRRHPPPRDVHERPTGPLAQMKGSISNQNDENVEAEAKQIVDLLGIDAIQGHPQYDAIKAGMEAASSSKTTQTAASPIKRKASEGPAIRTEVVERPSLPSTSNPHTTRTPVSDKPVSAFKRGLKAKPTNRPPMPPVPATPQRSQGISALERAAKSDTSLSKERQKRGLNPSVPHARPSKAFAEKLKARELGQDTRTTNDGESDGDDEGPAKMSRVRFSEKEDGQVAVKVGTAATQASERTAGHSAGLERDQEVDSSIDGDEEMAALGFEIREEELDDDEVEALGFFSDEEMDPDIGFDSDDLVEAIPPRFDSDAGEIDNEELRREYERMKASLQQSNSLMPKRDAGRDADDDDEMTHITQAGQDLSLADGDEDDQATANVSRFRRERLYRAMMNRPAVSRELGKDARRSSGNATHATDSSLQSVGPSMLLPSLANVRYPKPRADGKVPLTANEIELDGESDGEEDRLEDLMRARLDQRYAQDTVAAAAAAAASGPRGTESSSTTAAGQQPPTIAHSTGKSAKKPSLFKSRMQTGQ